MLSLTDLTALQITETYVFFAVEPTAHSEDILLIKKALSNQVSLEEQIKTLLNVVCPHFPDMVQQYIHLCQDLEGVLRMLIPNCTVHPFGSTITGLCFKNSDVDAHIKLPFRSSDVPGLIKKSKQALSKSRLFSHILAIPKAKTPIVKCVHVPTGLSCDFNFKNMLGVFNSHLISYYLSLDTKLSPIMIMIKYWAKVADLSGVNKFSNYSLALMFCFYLQQEPYCFPSVVQLQTDPSCCNIQENWNGGFKALTNYRNERIANASYDTILLEFFKFYANFDYASYVICPYTAKATPKIEFFSPQSLPDVYDRYKTNDVPLRVETCVCIQDPFEHSHNTTSSVPTTKLEDFVAYCKLAIEIFEHSEPKNILYELIIREPLNKLEKLKFNDTTSVFTFSMGSYLYYLYDKVEKEDDFSSMQRKMRAVWYNTVNEFIISILIGVLKLQVLVHKSEEMFAKLRKLNDQTDVHDTEIVDSVTFHCSGKQNLWESRKVKDVKLDEKFGVLERECALSDAICSSIANITLTENVIEFELTFNAKTNPTEAEFIIKKIAAGNKGAFRTLCAFFATRVTHWFEVYVRELNNAAKANSQVEEQ